MDVAVIGQPSGLLEEVEERLAKDGHRVVISDEGDTGDGRGRGGMRSGERKGRTADVVIDIAEPGAGDHVDRAEQVVTLLDRFHPARFVLISTVLVYAPVPDPRRWPILEGFPRRAHGEPAGRAYGQACIDAEDALVDEAGRRGVEYVILRPTVILGSSADGFGERVLTDLSERPWMAAGRYQGAGTMQWVDARDAAAAVTLAAVEPAAADEAFTIAGPAAFTSGDLARLATGRLDDLGDVSDPKFDTTKAETILGWRPAYQLVAAEPGPSGWWSP
ncbi:NAD(P)-dependent oxidoreductase [Microlunatus sp. Gsoil 973]|jgi:nucleoside-diphosphate-sugar epimerase|uniref:NAD-dependent epimerase/dehydratase family protein n=1 Tax=Microlunatus sp. Gsoil 973 TaxID=2672569 RepID=UPI0012B50145|nr:NAD-dependent epimerase/dehydratase family protein [Microlunatus sp. Gsoil 973]QGN32428.1 NAD-dependent epimerase/dehydratase family protein [Microlunatus sp. Gsoil 973]